MIFKRIPVLMLLLSIVLILAACAGSNHAPQEAATKSGLPTAALPTVFGPASGQKAAASASPLTNPSATKVASPNATSESPIAPESNPVGDIPDTQAFIPYAATSGNYSLEVPEGWARTNQASDARFDNKFDGVSISLKPASSAPTAANVLQNEVAALTPTERAFKVGDVTDVKLPGGQSVRITASANSDPDAVTGKQVRLEEEFYIFYQNGTMAIVKLWAPQGADNVDQWKHMVESFRWK